MEDDPSHQDDVTRAHLEKLVELALSTGASDARAIPSGEISVQDHLANLCVEPRCASYGLSPSCPPHVSGPSGFRDLQQRLKHAIVVRIIVPSSVLLSSEGWELGRFLYELVAHIEQEAVGMGYSASEAFAGGSCKRIFCHEHLECRRLSENGECRHPQHARSSMSGYGVDVFELMKTCGWPVNVNPRESEPEADSMSWVAGLIMIG
jgi:predicted metal-binding protein